MYNFFFYIFQILVHMFIFLIPCDAMYITSSCKEISNWKIKQQLGYNPRESDMSFHIIPQFKTMQRSSISDKSHEQFTRLFGNSTCPSELNTSAFPVMFRSSCPWYIELSVDKTRIPVTMAKARCRCKDCQTKTRPHPDFSCAAVKTYRRVLREIPNQCDNEGFKMYTSDVEEVPVACTCVATRTRI